MTRRLRCASLLATASLIALATLGSASATAPSPPSWALSGPYSPSIDPANFVRRIDNRFFLLAPGTGFRYVGHKGRTRQTDDMVVTHFEKKYYAAGVGEIAERVVKGGHERFELAGVTAHR